MKVFIIIIFLQFLFKISNCQEDLSTTCSENFCIEYIEKNKCQTLSEACQAQNATHNGIMVPSPMACNCCDACLDNLNEGAACSVGGVGSAIPDTICGPGLYCQDNICVKMYEITDTTLMKPCHQALANYNRRRADGELFLTELPPDCDLDGYYAPYKCKVGETCYCVDKNGKKIHGEIPYTSTAKYILNCECSRKFQAAQEFLGQTIGPDQFFRCKSNGDFDELQCLGDQCICVSPINGFPDGSPVKLADIASLPCFDPKIHNADFFNACAVRYLQLLAEVEELKKEYDEVFEFRYPNCDLTGNYAPVFTDLKNQRVYCADFNGNQIKKYSDSIENAEKVNCNCARAELLFSNPSNPDRSTCAANGNYANIQCRRGFCFCVDENGYQNTKEKPIDEISDLNCL